MTDAGPSLPVDLWAQVTAAVLREAITGGVYVSSAEACRWVDALEQTAVEASRSLARPLSPVCARITRSSNDSDPQ